MKTFLIIFRFVYLGIELFGLKSAGFAINKKQILFIFLTTPSGLCFNLLQLLQMAFINKPYIEVLNSVEAEQNTNAIIRHFIISIIIDVLVIKLVWFP